jgi:hypothetical protein
MASRDGISANQLQRELPLGNYRTATRCLHTLRQTMVPAGPPTRLCGAVAVQVVEYKRLLLAITMPLERERGLHIRRLPDRSPNSLRTFVRETVAPKQTVRTADQDLYDALIREDYDCRMTRGRDLRWGPDRLHWYDVNSVVPGVDRIVRNVMKWSRDLHRYAESDGLFLECLEEFVFRHKYPRACSRWKQLLTKALALEPDR